MDQISTFNLDLKDYGYCVEFNGGCSLNCANRVDMILVALHISALPTLIPTRKKTNVAAIMPQYQCNNDIAKINNCNDLWPIYNTNAGQELVQVSAKQISSFSIISVM